MPHPLHALVRAVRRRIRPSAVPPRAMPTPPPITTAPINAPHCNGRHGPDRDERGRTCEWCDALTSALTAIRQLERTVAELLAEKGRRD